MAAFSVIAAVGTAISAAGAVYSGIQQGQAASYNAKLATQNAASATAQSQLAADQQSRAAMLLSGATKAGYGASGVTNDGTPIDVLASSRVNAALDRQTILYKGQLQAMGYQDMAALDSARAGNAVPSGIAGAGGIAADGASKFFAMTAPNPGANLGQSYSGTGNAKSGYDTPGGNIPGPV